MADPQKEMGFTSRMKDFFGYRLGNTMTDFFAEIKALSYEDKCWFWDEFNKQGMPTTKPSMTPAK